MAHVFAYIDIALSAVRQLLASAQRTEAHFRELRTRLYEVRARACRARAVAEQRRRRR